MPGAVIQKKQESDSESEVEVKKLKSTKSGKSNGEERDAKKSKEKKVVKPVESEEESSASESDSDSDKKKKKKGDKKKSDKQEEKKSDKKAEAKSDKKAEAKSDKKAEAKSDKKDEKKSKAKKDESESEEEKKSAAPTKKRKEEDTLTVPAATHTAKKQKLDDGSAKTTADADVPEKLNAEEWRKKFQLRVPSGCPDPCQSFADLVGLKVPENIRDAINRMKYPAPTPIQAQTWPIAFGGEDMIGIAETGSGKTMAFILPALVRMMEKWKSGAVQKRKPCVLVMAPTRELAVQTEEVCQKLVGHLVSCVCVYGGDSKRFQMTKLKRGCDILVATPGRLLDFLSMGYISLNQVFYVVLDEADRMLDMGFEPQIREVFSHIPKERQTMLFTATFPNDIRNMALEFQKNPFRIQVGTNDMTANKNITQIVKVIQKSERVTKLKEILKDIFVDNCRILVFANKKVDCDVIAQNLWDEGMPVNAIHGDLNQAQRNRALEAFKSGQFPILFATDVAARGLDIKDVKYVVNLEFPPSGIDNYVHRIGRTGRAGTKGSAYTLFTSSDPDAHKLVDFMKSAGQEIPPELAELAAKKSFGGGRGRFGGRGGRGGRGGGRGGFGRGGGRGGFGGGGRGGRGGGYGGGFGGRSSF